MKTASLLSVFGRRNRERKEHLREALQKEAEADQRLRRLREKLESEDDEFADELGLKRLPYNPPGEDGDG